MSGSGEEEAPMADGITASEWTQMNGIIKTIHAADKRDLLPAFVEAVRAVIPFSHSMYHYSITLNGSTDAFAYGSADLSLEALEAYQQDFESIDYINWFADEPTPHVFRDTDLVPRDFRENSEIMRKWMQPNGLFYSIGLTIASHDNPYGNVYLFRTQDEGDFTEKDVAVLGILNEHLCIRYSNELPHGHADKVIANEASPLAQKYRLTQKESDVLACIADGRTRSSIAGHLFMSENTFKKHLANIYKKTGESRYEDLVLLVRP